MRTCSICKRKIGDHEDSVRDAKGAYACSTCYPVKKNG